MNLQEMNDVVDCFLGLRLFVPLVFHIVKGDSTGTWHLARHFTHTQASFPCITKVCRIILCLSPCLHDLFPGHKSILLQVSCIAKAETVIVNWSHDILAVHGARPVSN